MEPTVMNPIDISGNLLLIEDKKTFADDLILNLKDDINSNFKCLRGFDFHHLEDDNELKIREILSVRKFNILIVDLDLGVSYDDGIKTIKRVRNENQNDFVKIIVLSGHVGGFSYLLNFAKDVGADLICHKSQIENALLKILENTKDWYYQYLKAHFMAKQVNLYTTQIIDVDENDIELLFNDDSNDEQFSSWYEKDIIDDNPKNIKSNSCYRVFEFFKTGQYTLLFEKLDQDSILSNSQLKEDMIDIKKLSERAEKLGLDL